MLKRALLWVQNIQTYCRQLNGSKSSLGYGRTPRAQKDAFVAPMASRRTADRPSIAARALLTSTADACTRAMAIATAHC